MNVTHIHRRPSLCGALLLSCVVLLIGCKREYEAQWVFASSYWPIETNEVGQVVQPTAEEFRRRTHKNCSNLYRMTDSFIHAVDDELYSDVRNKLLFQRFLVEHDDFAPAQVSNAFASVRYEMTITIIPVVKVSVFSENPDVALAVLSFWAETYCNHMNDSEESLLGKRILSIKLKIDELQRKGDPDVKRLQDRLDAIRQNRDDGTMRTYTIEPPRIVNDD